MYPVFFLSYASSNLPTLKKEQTRFFDDLVTAIVAERDTLDPARVGFFDRDNIQAGDSWTHELAHALTHESTRSLSRGGREVVAESIAYAVCSLSGLEMELRSVDYVAGWLDDPDAFKAGMAAIHHGASSLISAVEPALLVADTELPLAA